MSFAHIVAAEDEPLHRQVPHNIEVEQALLGAILINNEAFYRVSVSSSDHFSIPAPPGLREGGQLIRLSKTADPRTLKSFLKENEQVGDITIAEYLARLAYEATTIINAEDYGRTIYDLSIRRNLITIGEDMVNIAYEAPVDMAPRDQIEDAERRLFELAERASSIRFSGLCRGAEAGDRHGGSRYQRAGHLSARDRMDDLDKMMGGLQNPTRHPRRPARHGQDGARHQRRL